MFKVGFLVVLETVHGDILNHNLILIKRAFILNLRKQNNQRVLKLLLMFN